ncbi:hypothetical protein ACWCYY_15115 [Kitasatospora sp. NPDC001664]
MAGQQYGSNPGPLGVGGKVLLALVPLLSLGLLGMVPSLVLAVRRRRAADVAGAVVAGLLQLLVYVAVGLTDPDPDVASGLDLAGGLALFALWLGGPVHFLVMDTQQQWRSKAPAPAPWYPPPVVPYQPQPQPSYPPRPQPQPQAGPATQDDLQQLGELLRRQAQEGRP